MDKFLSEHFTFDLTYRGQIAGSAVHILSAIYNAETAVLAIRNEIALDHNDVDAEQYPSEGIRTTLQGRSAIASHSTKF